jgi:20S proteasome subunit beta 3
MAYNGGCVVAMGGKNCVAIASDKRFGISYSTVSMECPKTFEMGPYLHLGLAGLHTDVLTVYQRLKFRLNLFELQENRFIKPKTFSSMVSNLLYERRFGPYFVEPIIAGLDPVTFQPFISVMDLIGCANVCSDFAVIGTSNEQLYGMCEALWKPDLEPEDLFESISQALMNAFDRDAYSGWGGVVTIIEKDKVTVKDLRTRMD